MSGTTTLNTVNAATRVELLKQLTGDAWGVIRGKRSKLVKEKISTTNENPHATNRATMVEIESFRTKLQKKTLVFKDIREKITTGHYYPTIGRDLEISDLVAKLLHIKNPGTLVEGTEGVGKSQIIVGLQKLILSGNVPPALQHARVIEVDLNHSTISNGGADSFKNRLEELKSFLAQNDPTNDGVIILVFNNVPGAFGEYISAATNTFGGSSRVRIIVKGTTDFFEKIKNEGSELSQVIKGFGSVEVKDLDDPSTRKLAQQLAERFSNEKNIHFSDESIENIIQWSRRYFSDQGFPESVVNLMHGVASSKEVYASSGFSPVSDALHKKKTELIHELNWAKQLKGVFARKRVNDIPGELADLDSLIAKVDQGFIQLKDLRERIKNLDKKLEEEEKVLEKINGEKSANPEEAKGRINQLIAKKNQLKTEKEESDKLSRMVNPEDVAQQISKETKVAIDDIMRVQKKLSIDEKMEAFTSRIFGQDHVLETIVPKVITAADNSFRLSNQPLVMMLLGPPGVGKTELANVIAYAHSDGVLNRYNMGTYGSEHTASALVGAPPSYVGFGEKGALVKDVRNNSTATILLDEYDHSHQRIDKTFFSIFSDGTMKDMAGNTADFSNSVFVLTSNLASDVLTPNMSRGQIIEHLIAASNGRYTPEFLDRIQEFAVYNPIDENVWIKIIDKNMKSINERARKKLNEVIMDNNAKKAIIKSLTGEGKTARDIDRAVKTHISDRLGYIEKFHQYKVKGDRTIQLTIEDGDQVIVRHSDELGFFFEIAK